MTVERIREAWDETPENTKKAVKVVGIGAGALTAAGVAWLGISSLMMERPTATPLTTFNPESQNGLVINTATLSPTPTVTVTETPTRRLCNTINNPGSPGYDPNKETIVNPYRAVIALDEDPFAQGPDRYSYEDPGGQISEYDSLWGLNPPTGGRVVHNGGEVCVNQ